VSFEGSNINSQNGTVTGSFPSTFALTGALPSVNPEDGTIIAGSTSIKVPQDVGTEGPTALRPGDIVLGFDGFDGGAAESGTLTSLVGAGGFHVQSASISVPLSRTPIERVGSKFPFARVVDFPVNATMTVNAVLNEIEAGNLAELIAGCASAEGKEVSILLKQCEGDDAIKWTLKGATLDSESWSSSVGSNKTVDITFGVQLGGIEDTQRGIICSGAGNVRPVFGA
jgi:hypothetical protein